jgi:hypothetical protein
MRVAAARPGIFSAQISLPKIFLLIGSLFVSVVISEITLRLFFAKKFPAHYAERSLLYEYHPTFGWFPPRNITRRFTWDRTTTVTLNSHGFRSPEPETNNKPGIMFLGDSFLWGFDLEASERFTDQLQARHPEWQIHNLGVCGYGTDQSFLLLQSYFDVYKPRAVILMYCTDNDWADNSSNVMRYGEYYKPFYLVVGPNALAVQGIPVPRSERVILAEHKHLAHSYLFRLAVQVYWKNRKPTALQSKQNPTLHLLLAMRKFVVEKGAFFAVAMQEKNGEFEQFLTSVEIPWMTIATTNKFAGNGHWNPEGNSNICNKLEIVLKAARQGGHINF